MAKAETGQPVPVALSVPNERALYDLLWGLNVTGEHPELPCLWQFSVTSGGTSWHAAPFLATLTEPDAAYVNYIVADEDGQSRCEVGCDECGSEGNEPWKPPGWPVVALVAKWPDADRCREDEIDPWWLTSEVCLPPVTDGGERRG